MDYHCPVCKALLVKRKFTHAIVARMDIDCSHCHNTIRLNIHQAEFVLIMVIFGAIALFALAAYQFQDERFALAAFGAAMLGALALPVLEKTCLRDWPRYVSIAKSPPP